MGFSRQEYWKGLPSPPPGDLPHPGMEAASLLSPELAGGFFTTSATWPKKICCHYGVSVCVCVCVCEMRDNFLFHDCSFFIFNCCCLLLLLLLLLLFCYCFSAAAAAKSFQSCPTLCDPIDGSPPGTPVPGILQARTLEWVAISFSNA